MNHVLLSAPSVGSLIKKITAINPDLGVQEIIQLVRQATRPDGSIDEALALELAQGLEKK
jgi:hypothetical protein